MNRPIDLYRKLDFGTKEISDKSTQDRLAAKLEASDFMTPELFPECCLGRSLFPPELTGTNLQGALEGCIS